MAFGLTPPRVRDRGAMRVKFFRARDLALLQDQINGWLAERADREIAEIRQSVAGGVAGAEGQPEFVVSVWYIEE